VHPDVRVTYLEIRIKVQVREIVLGRGLCSAATRVYAFRSRWNVDVG